MHWNEKEQKTVFIAYCFSICFKILFSWITEKGKTSGEEEKHNRAESIANSRGARWSASRNQIWGGQ